MSFEDKIAQQLRGSVTPTPPAMSFENKIALALQGSNWQQLQNSNNNKAAADTAAMQPEVFTQNPGFEELVVASTAEEVNQPPQLTAKQKKKKQTFERSVARDAGEVLQTIEPSAVEPVVENVTWDQDPELLCSYNWQDTTDDTNTIFVPGAPAKWSPPDLPHILEPDSGFQYADYNYARQPRFPYEPMFRALSLMNPSYDFTPIDVLCDRNNLRVLLEFVSGKANGPFRLDLHLISSTLVIVRNESKWWKFANGQSYGANFERFFTRPAKGMEDSTNHYRAIRYPLGPLNVVVRFEADAYDDGAETSDMLTLSEAEAVSGGSMSRPTFRYSAPIRVLQKGVIVPNAQMVELKTQAWKEEQSRVACQDQLWFGRTSLLYTGPYTSGTGEVKKIKYEDATARVKKWEENQQLNLRKLAGLLRLLKNMMQAEKRPNRAVVLVREHKAGPLSVRSMESMNRAIGAEAFNRHWRREAQTSSRGRGRGGRGYQSFPQLGRGDHGGARGRGHVTYQFGAARGGQASSVGARGGQAAQSSGRGGLATPDSYGRGAQAAPQADGRGGYVPQQEGRGGYTSRGGRGRVRRVLNN
ncbi:hypothetical protein IQ06DRAFT_214112 [Phaeosphaeriaceae sp. SRC1lsM3a]|nr:hypothetical protein IQ06DRAFT_214112 [Stagonospora sp. SRC1lsM3a]